MKRNPHAIVQQVCPCTKTKDGKYEVQVAIVRYKGIIGKCRMVSYVALRHMPFGDALDLLIKEACVTEEHLRAYLPCYAWGVQDPVRLPSVVLLSSIGLKRPPQSWQYLTDEQAGILERRGSNVPD